MELRPHLVGDDARHGGLAEPWRPGQEHVVGSLVALACRTKHDRKMIL
jgi:hypothetical protein